ncbi:hypothetical protein AC1031_011253 [Aphanomyces cochlioides]|nr:hypothetical protein AC1031_011253 [Aphanomyces cochlioides]
MSVDKKKHKTVLKWAFPVDVLVNIGFCISHHSDLFAFVEALRQDYDVGPLEHIWQLGLSLDHKLLWPDLVLTSRMTRSSQRVTYEAIAKFYRHIRVYVVMDIEWLKTHVDPKAELSWKLENLPGILIRNANYWSEWADLRICHLYVDCDFPSGWIDVLPRLQYLKTLILKTQVDTHVDKILEFAAMSDQLTELVISTSENGSLTDPMLRNIIAWLSRQLVRVFAISGWEWRTNNMELKQSFYQAMFNCPTLKELKIAMVDLSDMDLTNATLSMQTLQIRTCFVSPNFCETLAARLIDSNVLDLSLVYTDDTTLKGIESLLRVLPKTSIKSLDLVDSTVSSADICEFAPLLQASTLNTLKIRYAELHEQAVSSLANAIQNNTSIAELDITGTVMTSQDCHRLIESATHTSRPIEMKWIAFQESNLGQDDLKALSAYATERGIQFDC